jgi:hypothetical protein
MLSLQHMYVAVGFTHKFLHLIEARPNAQKYNLCISQYVHTGRKEGAHMPYSDRLAENLTPLPRGSTRGHTL